MIKIHNLGFPRLGAKRELKFGLERYWKGQSSLSELQQCASEIRITNLQHQSDLDLVPVGDFSLYDQVLDMSFALGHLPDRAKNYSGSTQDNYFRLARGRSAGDNLETEIRAQEMTKWFDTNYHYLVPEVKSNTTFSADPSRLLELIKEAKQQGATPKPVLIGPVTYLWLCKSKDGTEPLSLLPELLSAYTSILVTLAEEGIEWVQMDEPALVTELADDWLTALRQAYTAFSNTDVKLLLTTYFGRLEENWRVAKDLPVAGLHIDAIRAKDEIYLINQDWPADKILSLGVIDGRNIWKTDFAVLLAWLTPIAQARQSNLWLAPSCSLLHVPVDLQQEQKMDKEIKSWLAFAVQKLEELSALKSILNEGTEVHTATLEVNAAAWNGRRQSHRVNNPRVQAAVANITNDLGNRQSAFENRRALQATQMPLPAYPTTTIGSFPQTADIRSVRRSYKNNQLSDHQYREAMKREIAACVKAQEDLGLDVLVHGEAERNDMVEYFGEHLAGYVFSEYGWVQSYGSRGVKPPIIFGDICRPKPITVEWAKYAQSLTKRPMKGMLTGPVTILNWSFVRDDQPRSTTCMQLALAMRDEVKDLEAAGIRIIQVDEAALREGLPLRQSEWQTYLDWAVLAFRICANGVKDDTQIHTHMCYSEFNDIMPAIAEMDADVITIETSRSDMELLDAFKTFDYPNDIGPGVYDIHSPNVPSVSQMIDLMRKAATRIPKQQLWINPDCGLKTRRWAEVEPALTNMVAAAEQLRRA